MPLRDLFVITIVVVLGLIALRRPWVGVMNWTWISIMNPHRYSWGFAFSAPVAMIAGVTVLLGLLFTKERRSPFQGAPVWWLLLFFIWITLSWLFGFDPSGDYAMWDRVMKIYLMTFVTLMLLHSKLHIMAYVWVTIGSLALLASKGGLFTLLNAGNYRVWGPAGSFIEDNNHFALAAIVTVPMLHFLQIQLPKRWMRHGMSIVMLLTVAAALGSHSRGALLALGAMGAAFWWHSSRKGLITLLLIVVALALLPMMPEHWWVRMATIQEFQEDASAMGRINAWYVAWDVATTNFFGAGMSYQHQYYYDLYGRWETIIRAAHSIYFQILGNHGFVGLILFLMIWITSYTTANKLQKESAEQPETKWAGDLSAMAKVSLIGYLVGGAFLSMPYFDLPYNIMVMIVLTRQWVLRRSWETVGSDPRVPAGRPS